MCTGTTKVVPKYQLWQVYYSNILYILKGYIILHSRILKFKINNQT